MKTILAPVDFSDNAANALLFGAELAKRSSAQLMILSVVESKQEEEKAMKKLEIIEADLKKKGAGKLQCDKAVMRGNFLSVMKKVIASSAPDLIVMGTKGASGLKRILIGSNTVNVISKTKLPVLVIPESARFSNFMRKGKNKIVLATNLELLKNEDALDALKEIALMIIEPKMRVVSIRPRNTSLSLIGKLERDRLLSFFGDGMESERITIFSDDVISGINFYLNKNADTGLVAMIARDSGLLIRKHYTRQMASRTNLPLLVLHDTEK